MTDHTRCQFSDDGTSRYGVLGSERNRRCPEGAVRQFALVSGPTVLILRREFDARLCGRFVKADER